MFFDFEKFYNRKIPSKQIFIDVGANKGHWFHKINKIYPKSRIYAVEPIKGMTKAKQNVTILNMAIDIKGGLTKNFYITREKVTSSLLQQERSIIDKFITFKDKKGFIHKKSDYDVVKKIKIKTIRLDKIIKEHKLKEVHYLKIDSEGNDLNVLKSLGKEIKKIWGFELETWNEKKTLWKNQHWIKDCEKFIKKSGFQIVRKFVHGKGRSTDLLCIRNDLVKFL